MFKNRLSLFERKKLTLTQWIICTFSTGDSLEWQVEIVFANQRLSIIFDRGDEDLSQKTLSDRFGKESTLGSNGWGSGA